MDDKLAKLAELALDHALSRGAEQVAVSVYQGMFIEIKRRAGAVEGLQSSEGRGLSVALYAGGRYSSNATSFLQEEPVRHFIDEALAMTRHLAPDRFRALPDPELYGPTQGVELDLIDPGYGSLTMERRLELVEAAENAALDKGGDKLISVTAEMVTSTGEALKLHSNGFRGERRSTRFQLSTAATARDAEDRRPEDYWAAGARHLSDLPDATTVGAEASRRALARVGGRKVQSKRMPLLVENRSASRMVSALLEPLSGAALQQHRSCFADKVGQPIGSKLLDIRDEPLLRRGLGSRTFDEEGLASRPLPVISHGRLDNFFIDVYYGRKLEMPPTTGSTSNLILTPGTASLDELIGGVHEGILVTGFLGGNSNPATGDFSFGINGFVIKDGKLDHPISEMNITDNTTRLWHRLEGVGNDPYPFSSWRVPSLLFGDVQFSGL